MIKPKTYRKLNDVNALKKAHAKLTKYFNLFIRLRDLKRTPNGDVIGYDISTGKMWVAKLYSDRSIMNGKEFHASHYWDSDKYESVRYDERNVNGQLSYNNRQKHGDKSNYEIGLRKKIGNYQFELLKVERNKLKKYNIVELEQLTDYYKLKSKEHANRLQVKI